MWVILESWACKMESWYRTLYCNKCSTMIVMSFWSVTMYSTVVFFYYQPNQFSAQYIMYCIDLFNSKLLRVLYCTIFLCTCWIYMHLQLYTYCPLGLLHCTVYPGKWNLVKMENRWMVVMGLIYKCFKFAINLKFVLFL